MGLVMSSVPFLDPKYSTISAGSQNTHKGSNQTIWAPAFKVSSAREGSIFKDGDSATSLGYLFQWPLSRLHVFPYIQKYILWLLPPLKDLYLRLISQNLSEFFLQILPYRITFYPPREYGSLSFTTFHKIQSYAYNIHIYKTLKTLHVEPLGSASVTYMYTGQLCRTWVNPRILSHQSPGMM